MASKTTLRTHNCGELTLKNDGEKVKLCGWDHARRDHGGIIFIDLRDRYGLTQVVFDPKHKKEAHTASEELSREDVIQIEGTVRERPKGMENKKLPTGEIEVLVDKIHVLAKADTPPLEVDDRISASEEMRLKFRYLDLRRPIMQKRLMFRHKLAQAARQYLSDNDFMEIETPILVRSTPEGARDYIVPSRVHPGKFYALPQSPQLYKQISMVAGCDRYFQLARCLRDEDLRADRQPEHTQIDIEMSFVDMDDVLGMVEGLVKHLFKKTLDVDLKTPFVRIPHREAMEKYGIDKPDLRFGLELCDVTDLAKKSEFQVFKNAEMTKCLACEDKFSRKDIEDLTAMAQAEGAKGLAWIRLTDKGPEGTIAKFVDKKIIDEIVARSKAKAGGILFFIADKKNVCNSVLSKVRLKVGDLQGLRKDEFKFCWVTEFPLFSWNEEEEKWDPEHHIFTHPLDEDLKYLDTDPSKVHGKLYDLVLNGTELSSGSIRINRREMQQKVFAVIGMKPEDAEVKFGFLLKAFKYGAPPHGGVGIGLDRLCALMQGLNDIREVIAYPKNKSAECPMDGSPNIVDERQMKDLHLKCEVTVKARDVVFDQIKEYFDNSKVNYSVIEHKAVFKADEAAKARGVEPHQVAKAMVCKSENKYIMALIPGDKELDLDKLRMTAGVKNLVLASSDEVRDITGCSVAAVPPFGNFFSLDMYIDKRLMEEKTIAFNAGSQTKSIKMFLGDYKSVMKLIQGDFAK